MRKRNRLLKENRFSSKIKKTKISVFLLNEDFGEFKKGEIFEEFYTNDNDFYSKSSDFFNPVKRKKKLRKFFYQDIKKAKVSFFKNILPEDSMLYQLHHKGVYSIKPSESL